MLEKEKALKIEKRKSKSNHSYKVFYFQCTDCKDEIKAQLSQLKTHSGKCRSCTQKGEPYKFIYTELKDHRNNNVEFTLSFKEFLNIISKPKCEYCDIDLIYNKHSRDENRNYVSRAHQLDRKNNNKGYTLDNVVPCCWECNRLKSDRFTYEEFMQLSPVLKNIIKIRNEK